MDADVAVIPFILTTSTFSDEDLPCAVNAGADGSIQKDALQRWDCDGSAAVQRGRQETRSK